MQTSAFSTFLRSYYDARIAKILLIGAMSGLPWVLHGTIITLWLKDADFSRSAIGLFGYIAVVYALNFLWAPLVDSLRIPWLTQRLGKRRAWIVLMQAVIILSVIMLSFFSVSTNLWMVAFLAFLVAAASATQDVAIDAMRIELMRENEQAMIAAGAAMATVGWYTGYNLGGAFALHIADAFKQAGVGEPWQAVLLLMALVIVAMNVALWFAKESEATPVTGGGATAASDGAGGARHFDLGAAYIMPLVAFFKRNGVQTALLLLGFIALFKVGEAFLGRMSLVFYKEIGFSEADIANYSKLLGWGVLIMFAILGSFFSIRYGLLKGLIICGIAMAASNLMFAWLAHIGPDTHWFAAAIVLDQFTTSISTVAFVAFVSQLCDRSYTATQYALLASLGNFSRTSLSAHSGQMVDALQGAWDVFFILTALMVIPSLILLVLARERIAPLLR